METFLVWAIDGNRLKTLLELLHQLCHVMLGLRPASRIEEGRLVLSWIRREQKRGLRIGDFWYLVASAWWKQWLDYVLNQVLLFVGNSVKLGNHHVERHFFFQTAAAFFEMVSN